MLENEDEEGVDHGVRKIMEDSRDIRRICNNSSCLTVKTKSTSNGFNESNQVKMLTCRRCKIATYCSVSSVATAGISRLMT